MPQSRAALVSLVDDGLGALARAGCDPTAVPADAPCLTALLGLLTWAGSATQDDKTPAAPGAAGAAGAAAAAKALPASLVETRVVPLLGSILGSEGVQTHVAAAALRACSQLAAWPDLGKALAASQAVVRAAVAENPTNVQLVGRLVQAAVGEGCAQELSWLPDAAKSMVMGELQCKPEEEEVCLAGVIECLSTILEQHVLPPEAAGHCYLPQVAHILASEDAVRWVGRMAD